jgi:hypothetical protein
LLEETRCGLIIQIWRFPEAQAEHIQWMLKRLARHGDRIQLVMDEVSLRILPVDSSVFNLSLPTE